MKLSNKTYDTLKTIALIGTPVITFLAALCTIWQVPHCSEITASLAALDALLAVFWRNYRMTIKRRVPAMSETIIVAILSLVGTCVGSVVAVITSNNLTKYKIEELTKQVEKHNQVIERTFMLEQHQAVIDEQIKVANHRIEDLEEELKK